MDTWLSHCRPRFELCRGVIAEGRGAALPIIEHLNVLKDIPCRVVTGGLVPMVHELALEGPEEAFDAGVVPTITCAAHTGRDAVGGK